MKITVSEKRFLINKYIRDGLSKKDIDKRLKEINNYEDYIKFTNKYLKKWKH